MQLFKSSIGNEGQIFIIMGWTTKEKIAVLKSLAFIVGADRKIEPQEMAVIAGFLKRYGLDFSAMNDQANMSQNEMARIISNLSNYDKQTVKGYWKEAIVCDGNVDDKEIEVFVMMAEECDIDISDIQ